MTENTSIEWADHSFNAWIGCAKVSPGCKNCYAEQIMDKRWGKVQWGPGGTRERTSMGYWGGPLKWSRQAAAMGIRQKVFCNSLADVFEDREDLVPWRRDLFRIIAQTPSLDWLILTKRPENIKRLWPEGFPPPGEEAWPNVWLGTSVEDQEFAEKRIPELLAVPARVRFLSCEPLLGPVDLEPFMVHGRDVTDEGFSLLDGLHWVIAGGESGQGARPMSLAWVRELRDQCAEVGISFFMKQLGSVATAGHGKGGGLVEIPEDLRVREFPEVA